MNILINSIFFLVSGLLLFTGWMYFKDKSRTVDQLPGILFFLIGVREIFFIIPNLSTKLFRTEEVETFTLLFFQGIIASYLIAIISVKKTQGKIVRAKKDVNSSG